MNENYKKVLELISDNEELKSRIEAIEKESSSVEEILDKVNPLIKEFGLALSMDDFAIQAENAEISENELESVAGGKMCGTATGLLCTDCFCAFGGGGTADEYQKACACVLAGVGEFTEKGKQAVEDGKVYHQGTSRKPQVIICAVTGMY